MQDFLELLKILVPAGLVLYMAYLAIQSFNRRQLDELRLTIQQKNQEVVVPIRLQAYERICLLLERISPNNAILRVNTPETTAQELQHKLIADIREEYNHNLSQQVYMSDEAWSYVSGAVEDVISMINEAGNETPAEANSIELARKVIELNLQKDEVAKKALIFVKGEIRQVY